MNRPAFPSLTPYGQYNIGMNLRQIYANNAMGAMLVCLAFEKQPTKEERTAVFDELAGYAFEIADAMLRHEETSRG